MDDDVETRLVNTSSNPGNCYCGWYTYYSSVCNHQFEKVPIRCGNTTTKSGLPGFCRYPAPNNIIDAVKVNQRCKDCWYSYISEWYTVPRHCSDDGVYAESIVLAFIRYPKAINHLAMVFSEDGAGCPRVWQGGSTSEMIWEIPSVVAKADALCSWQKLDLLTANNMEFLYAS